MQNSLQCLNIQQKSLWMKDNFQKTWPDMFALIFVLLVSTDGHPALGYVMIPWSPESQSSFTHDLMYIIQLSGCRPANISFTNQFAMCFQTARGDRALLPVHVSDGDRAPSEVHRGEPHPRRHPGAVAAGARRGVRLVPHRPLPAHQRHWSRCYWWVSTIEILRRTWKWAFSTMLTLSSATSLVSCYWMPVFYMDWRPIWSPHSI